MEGQTRSKVRRRRPGVAPLVTVFVGVAVVLGVLTVVVVAAKGPFSRRVIDAGLVASAPLPRAEPPQVPVGASGLAAPALSEPVRELVELRTASTETWDTADGLRLVRQFDHLRYFQRPGTTEWSAIDTSLSAVPGRPGWWASGPNDWQVVFGPAGAPSGGEQLVLDGKAIAVAPVGTAGGADALKVEGSTARYEDLWPGVDAVYRVSPEGVEEDLVLKRPGLPAIFGFDLSGAAAHLNSSNGLDVVVDGRRVAEVPAPVVSTARGPVASEVSGARLSVGSGAAAGRVEVAVDDRWLASVPEADYPVVIDPTINRSVAPVSVKSFSDTVGTINGTLQVGVDSGYRRWRAGALFPVPAEVTGPASPPWVLHSAVLKLFYGPGSRGPGVRTTTAFGEPFEPNYSSLLYYGEPLQPYGGNDAAVSWEVTARVRAYGAAWYGFVGDEDPSNGATLQSFSTPSFSGAYVSYYYSQAPPATAILSPAQDATITTATPTLLADVTDCPARTACTSTVDPTVYYDFKVATSPNGTGTVVDSGWLPFQSGAQPRFAVPRGALVDGMSYYATVLDNIGTAWGRPGDDGYVAPAAPKPPVRFTVKQRKGGGGPSPTDTVGATPQGTSTPSEGSPSPGVAPASVTVNMVTGNLSLQVAPPSFKTVSGSAGVTFGYDSIGAEALGGAQRGLYAQYYTDSLDHSFDPARLIGQRFDPSVDFSWSGGSPMGGLGMGTGTLAKWTGTITVPTGGTWRLGGMSGSGGMRVYIDGGSTAVFDGWTASYPYPTVPSYGIVTVGGGQHQIEVQYWSPGYSAVGQLWARNLAAPDAPPLVVPTSWLTPKATGLPAGWKIAQDAGAASWSSLHDGGDQVVLSSATGSTSAFTRQWDGRYQAPAGSNDLLSVVRSGPEAGRFQLSTDSALTYLFNRDGSLASVNSIADDTHPANLQYSYAAVTVGGPPVLAAITDPVRCAGAVPCPASSRITLSYAGTAACPAPPTGLSAPPAGMLCQVSFWDGTSTKVHYNSNGQLAQVVHPGEVTAAFGYDSQGRLADVRDPLAIDAMAAGTRSLGPCQPAIATSYCGTDTQIAYDASGKVSTVTQPAPTNIPIRPTRTYTYRSLSTEMSMRGFDPVAGYASKVDYDDKGRVVARTSSAGLRATTTWDDLDRPIVSVDPAQGQTTTIWDANNNVTDTYGPAPTACFATTKPYAPLAYYSSACGVAVPRTSNGYDEGTTGLAAAFWSNPSFAAAPVKHQTGMGGTGPSGVQGCYAGSLCSQWNTPPVTGDATPGPFQWSMRLTGSITLPSARALDLYTTQRATVYADGQSVASLDVEDLGEESGVYGQWRGGLQSRITLPAGTHRIQVDYLGSATALNGLGLIWGLPGYWVPTSALNPAYGLKTSTADADGKTQAVAYTDSTVGAEFGLPTATTADPGGLALTTTTSYEAPGAGSYLRRTAKSLPAGNKTTFSNYCGRPGTSECTSGQVAGAIASACGVVAGAGQAGLLAQQSDPDPDGGGPQEPRVEQFLYDPAGRQVGRRISSSSGVSGTPWQCTSYDARGRILSQTWPARNGATARSVAHLYAVGGDPLRTTVTDGPYTLTSTVDLLGRAISYTDAWGTTTTTAYRQSGEVETVTGTGTGTQATTYDANTGRPATITLDGTTMATMSYDTATGRLRQVDYANATRLVPGYDPLGRQNSASFTNAATGARIAGDAVTRSPAGRVVDQEIDTGGPSLVDPNPEYPNFDYDGAGRLNWAWNPTGRETYDYSASTCPTAPAAGKNTNRTRVTRGAVTDSYCYDQADRLQTGPGITGVSYDDHGNTITLTGATPSTFGWDAAERNITVTQAGTTTAYTRDPVDRVLVRQRSGAATETTRYGYTGHQAASTYTLNTANTITSRTLGLPGGVTLTTGTAQSWAYSNLHGDTTATADASGNRTGTTSAYTAWGTGTAPNSIPGTAQPGYLGTTTEPPGQLPITQMGARPYIPTLGRFLSVDPVEGGCANNYVYVHGDPVNTSDRKGRASCSDFRVQSHDGVIIGRLVGSTLQVAWEPIFYERGNPLPIGMGGAVISWSYLATVEGSDIWVDGNSSAKPLNGGDRRLTVNLAQSPQVIPHSLHISIDYVGLQSSNIGVVGGRRTIEAECSL